MKLTKLYILSIVWLFSALLGPQVYAAEYKGADLPATIHTLAKNAGVYAIINEEVQGKVYMTVPDNATMTELMSKLSEAYDFNWKIEDGYLFVSPAKINSHTKTFAVRYANLTMLKGALASFLPESSVTVNPEYSTITVDGTPWQVAKAKKKIDEVDVPIQQVLIQAQMVELSKNDSEKLGFSQSWGEYSDKTNNIKNISYAITLNAESIISHGRILARPSVATLNGLKAELLMGDKVPVVKSDSYSDGSKSSSVEYQEVGVKLHATPRINGLDTQFVTMELNPEISSIVKWVEYEGSTAPQIATRQAKTTVRIGSGETIIIGGLIKDEEVRTMSGIPLLKDLPLLGNLFRSKNNSKVQTEVFIFVTPYILDENGGLIQKPEKPAKQENDNSILPSSQEEKPLETPSDQAPEEVVVPAISLSAA